MSEGLASNRVRESYEAVPYEGGAHFATHPAATAAVAQLMGMEPADPEACRVLELGCATGGNLNPMAAQLPGSEFVGIDLSESQIAIARDLAASAHIENVRFEAMDIMEAGLGLGRFDYIICHGVYSWVPSPVRKQILSLCAELLKPGGLAYISYNTLPGSQRRTLASGIAQFGMAHVLEEDAPIRQVVAFWNAVANAMPERGHPVASQLLQALREVENEEEFYIAHEYLEDVNEPVWFYEVATDAASVGLQYVGESGRTVELDDFPASVQEQVRPLSPSLVAREQMLDLLANTAFRRSLFCHESVELARAPDADAVLRLFGYASSQRQSEAQGGAVTFRTRAGRSLTTNDPHLVAALDTLQEIWPGGLRLRDLYDAAHRGPVVGPHEGDPMARFSHSMVKLWLKNAVTLTAHPLRAGTEAGERPVASPIARIQARLGRPVTNLLHQTVTLPDEARLLLPLLDGTRDVAGLSGEWAESGNPEVPNTEPPDKVGAYLERFVKLGLISPSQGPA